MIRKIFIGMMVLAVVGFLTWRFLRPMNIFDVSEAFERPIATNKIPAPLQSLRAKECGQCHNAIFAEWKTTIHSCAWTDPYFQADWIFDGSQQICKNCHIPLDRQQEQLVTGFHDKEKWQPILEPNPDFDAALQHEGVTCAACHLREGKIQGTRGGQGAPHPVKKIDNGNEICVRCHIVDNKRWDTAFRFPPCGTVAEIQSSQTAKQADHSGEVAVPDTRSLGCVGCHMPMVDRPLVAGGVSRMTRQHLWRGGHDPSMVKQGLDIKFEETRVDTQRTFVLTLTNVGAAHYIPTGTPDRHLTVDLKLFDQGGKVIKKQSHVLKRTIMWRPFIVDLWDTRLPRGERRRYDIAVSLPSKVDAAEAVVRYHLVAEDRRKRIGYDNQEPMAYEVYRKRLTVD